MDKIEDRNADGARQATPTEMATLIAGVILGRKRGWRHLEDAAQEEVDTDVCDQDNGSGIAVVELEVDDVSVELEAAQGKDCSKSR